MMGRIKKCGIRGPGYQEILGELRRISGVRSGIITAFQAQSC